MLTSYSRVCYVGLRCPLYTTTASDCKCVGWICGGFAIYYIFLYISNVLFGVIADDEARVGQLQAVWLGSQWAEASG